MVAKLKGKDVTKLKAKSVCCKKDERSLRCPVVVHRLCQQDSAVMCGKDFKKSLARARRR